MAFWNYEQKNTQPTIPPAVAECDHKIRALDEERSSLLQQIGELYLKEYGTEQSAGTPFDPLVRKEADLKKQQDALERRKLAVQGLRKCDGCGNILPIDSLFCNKCGLKLEDIKPEQTSDGNANICPKCGANRSESAAFCIICGHKFE